MIKGLPKKEYYKQYYSKNKELIKQVKIELEDDKRLIHRELHRKLGTLKKTQKARRNELNINQ